MKTFLFPLVTFPGVKYVSLDTSNESDINFVFDENSPQNIVFILQSQQFFVTNEAQSRFSITRATHPLYMLSVETDDDPGFEVVIKDWKREKRAYDAFIQ